MKIKSIEISGIRGVLTQLSLPLDGKSLLIYGDNGGGKSSITDGVEWFYSDQVGHLSTEEIGRKGIAGLRNLFLKDDIDAFVDIQFSDKQYNSKKKLYIKKGALIGEHSNLGEEFSRYLTGSSIKNLILRYQALLEFILSAKSDKLREISQIIGFEEVTKTREVFKKAVNDLKKEIKLRDYDSQINSKQSIILEQVSRNINDDAQYLEAVSELIAPLKLQIVVKDIPSVDKIIEQIQSPENEEYLKLQLSCEKVLEFLAAFSLRHQEAVDGYLAYLNKYEALYSDKDKLKNIALERLLAEGLTLLKRDDFSDDVCPLCLQEKSREDLLAELRSRVHALTAYKTEKQVVDALRQDTVSIHETIRMMCESILREPLWLKKEALPFKQVIETLRDVNSKAMQTIEAQSVPLVPTEEYFPVDSAELIALRSKVTGLKQEAFAIKKDDLKFSINNKLLLTKTAYLEIVSMKRARTVFSNQLAALELLYSSFVAKQSEGLAAFLTSISKDINDYYCYMNASEGVDEIQLVPIESDGELVGLTLQFKFHGKLVSPPDKYLSESHLNCLGICLFLASTKVFGKNNKYFILDDVVSSFDSTHRLRFVNLLLEKFSDYQILVLTHNTSWFTYFANAVKGKAWQTNKIRWSSESGVCLEAPPLSDLKAKIDAKILASDPEGLGTLIRKYLEQLLKKICYKLGIKVQFRFNDENENRMSYELLTELKSSLANKKSDLLDKQLFESLLASTFIGNKDAHDSDFVPTVSDHKAFYADVQKLEKIFRCQHCGKLISRKYYVPAEKKIGCGCSTGSRHSWE